MNNTAVFLDSKNSDALRRSEETCAVAVAELNLVRASAATADHALREENFRAFIAMRSSYQDQLLNLTVTQRSESIASNAEIARLTVHNEPCY
eukprot:12858196-Heterocapsa_arctica.AAC.1